MKKTTKNLLVAASIATALTFTGCTQDQENLALAGAGVAAVAIAASNTDGSSTDNYYHHGEDYGEKRNYNYRDGVRAGCDSRTGRWSQNNYRYQNDYHYRDGWKAGYNQCR